MKRKTRIRRIAVGEEIIAPIIAEDLQDQYEAMIDLQNLAVTTHERLQANPKDKRLHKDLKLATFDFLEAQHDFWCQVNERYDVWHLCVGIRDGYALVKEGAPQIGILRL